MTLSGVVVSSMPPTRSVVVYSLKRKGVLYLRKGETSLEVASKLIELKVTGITSF